MEVIETRGLKNPKPLIIIKQAMSDLSMPEEFLIKVDSLDSKEDIENFLKENKIFFKTRKDDNDYEIIVNRSKTEPSTLDLEENAIICFGKDQIGSGNKELGNELIREFIVTLNNNKLILSKIIFFNSGVFLLAEESPVLDEFRTFEKAGIELLLCEKSVDFYNLKNKIHLGLIVSFKQISNFIINSKKVLVF